LTDPTGLDFYQECKQEDDNKQMCNTVAGYGKRTFYGTTQNGQFKPTVITSASLEDANSGNTARVDENGVQLTTKNGTSQGVFITGTPAANNIQGKGALLGFSFNIKGNCRGDCLNSGTFKFSGTPAQARAALKAAGSWNYGFWDALNSTAFGHHPYSDQFRFGSGPSAHLSVPWDIIPGSSDFGPASIINPLSTVPATGDFHTDPTVGFEHAKCSNIPGVSCN
jgi:hypothetical protein